MLDLGKLGLIRLFALIAVALPGMTALGQTKPSSYPNRNIKIIAPVSRAAASTWLRAPWPIGSASRWAYLSSSTIRAAAGASSDRWPLRAPRPTATP
jgi:hypothetical protein